MSEYERGYAAGFDAALDAVVPLLEAYIDGDVDDPEQVLSSIAALRKSPPQPEPLCEGMILRVNGETITDTINGTAAEEERPC